MKRILKFVVRLYPAWWRRRYGPELEALLDDSESHWTDLWNLLRKAMELQMMNWTFGRIVGVCGLAGALVASGFAFTRPYRYQSTAVLKLPSAPSPAAAVSAALTPNSLTGVIEEQHLYTRESQTRSKDDVIDIMRRAIRIERAGEQVAAVSFLYQDAESTQRTTQSLVQLLVDKGGFEVLDAPQRPTRYVEKKRYALAGFGLPAGLLFGVVVALFFRRRPSASN